MAFRRWSGAVGASLVLSCATAGRTPVPTDAVVIDAYRNFGRGDCAAVRKTIRAIDFMGADATRRALLQILEAWCLELSGDTEAAREIYLAIVDAVPRTTLAYDAALRLRSLAQPDPKAFREAAERRRRQGEAGDPPYASAAKPIHRNVPAYPEAAAAAEIEGRVLVDFGIAPNGDVVEPEVLASEPPFLFDGAALAAVRHWTYEPSTTDAERRGLTTLEFRLERAPDR
jgi:TonB family protein